MYIISYYDVGFKMQGIVVNRLIVGQTSLYTGHSQGIVSGKGKETYQNTVDEERKRPSL